MIRKDKKNALISHGERRTAVNQDRTVGAHRGQGSAGAQGPWTKEKKKVQKERRGIGKQKTKGKKGKEVESTQYAELLMFRDGPEKKKGVKKTFLPQERGERACVRGARPMSGSAAEPGGNRERGKVETQWALG